MNLLKRGLAALVSLTMCSAVVVQPFGNIVPMIRPVLKLNVAYYK